MGGGTHRHSTPHHGGGHAQTQHAPTRGGSKHHHSTSPGQANTTDNQHLTTFTVRRQRQKRTNKTSRASSRLQHHEPKSEHAPTARRTKGGRHAQTRHAPAGGATHQPRTNSGQANNTTATATHPTDGDHPSQTPPNHAPPSRPGWHQRSTPHQEGGHAPTQQAPPRTGQQTNAARPTMGGGHTNTAHPTMGSPRTNIARPNRGGGTHQHSTNPGQANNATATQQTTTT